MANARGHREWKRARDVQHCARCRAFREPRERKRRAARGLRPRWVSDVAGSGVRRYRRAPASGRRPCGRTRAHTASRRIRPECLRVGLLEAMDRAEWLLAVTQIRLVLPTGIRSFWPTDPTLFDAQIRRGSLRPWSGRDGGGEDATGRRPAHTGSPASLRRTLGLREFRRAVGFRRWCKNPPGARPASVDRADRAGRSPWEAIAPGLPRANATQLDPASVARRLERRGALGVPR
jgi:hypothetical protein